MEESTLSDVCASNSSGSTPLKCVLVGDNAVGKTSLVISYTTNGFPSEYRPTTYDTYTVDVEVEGHNYKLLMCDTAGQPDLDSFRPLAYPDTHVFLLCFSVAAPESFRSLRSRWAPELRAHAPSNAALLLVGLRSDLRQDAAALLDLAARGQQPISEEEAVRFAKEVQAEAYLECSALTQQDLKEVFDSAIWTAIKVAEASSSSGSGGLNGHSGSFGRGRKKLSAKVSDKRAVNCTPPLRHSEDNKKTGKAWKKLLCVGDSHSAS